MNKARTAAVAASMAVLGCALAQPAHGMRTYVNYDSLVITAGPGETNLLTVQPDPNTTGRFLIVDAGATITPGAGCTSTPLGKVVTCTIKDEYASAPSLSLSLRDGPDVATVDGPFFLFQVDGGFGDDRLDLSGSQAQSPGGNGGYTHVQLGGGNDTLKLDGAGFPVDVQVFGGDGNDTIDATDQWGGVYYGDRGDDSIKAPGLVSGGDGADTIDGTPGFDWSTYFGDAGDDDINTFDLFPDEVDCGTGTDSVAPDEVDVHTGCESVS